MNVIGNIVGSADIRKVCEEEEKIIQCQIRKFENAEENEYRIYHNDVSIGEVTFKYLKTLGEVSRKAFYKQDPIKQSGKLKGVFKSDKYPFYGPLNEGKLLDKIYIVWIGSSENRYKGVGRALIQSVIEDSFSKGFKGRVDLHATESFEFFYTQGFRALHQTLNDQLQKEYEAAQKEFRRMRPLIYEDDLMYLPEKAINDWKIKILKKPIHSTLTQ